MIRDVLRRGGFVQMSVSRNSSVSDDLPSHMDDGSKIRSFVSPKRSLRKNIEFENN